MTPVAARIPYQGLAWKAPLITRNSPIKPFMRGRPTDARTVIKKKVAYFVIGVANPPNKILVEQFEAARLPRLGADRPVT